MNIYIIVELDKLNTTLEHPFTSVFTEPELLVSQPDLYSYSLKHITTTDYKYPMLRIVIHRDMRGFVSYTEAEEKAKSLNLQNFIIGVLKCDKQIIEMVPRMFVNEYPFTYTSTSPIFI